MLIESSHCFLDIFLCSFSGALVELHNTKAWEDPSASSGENFRVGEIQPLEHLRLSHGILATTELIIGDVVGDGVAFEQAHTVVAFKGRNLKC